MNASVANVIALRPAGSPRRAAELHASPSAEFETKLAHTRAVLQSAALQHGGRIVLATSLGAEDMVLTDLIALDALPIDLVTLDTGLLHDETLALIPRIEARYGLRVERFAPPTEATAAFVQQHGDDAMYQSIELRKACCAVRKLEPLSRALAGRSAWITGLRREQSGTRAEVPFSDVDANGRVKLNPLADWTWGDVWHHLATRDVPTNPLHDRFYPSIGCAPCTRAISLGEEFRAGRWWWENEDAKECGLHVKPHDSDTHAPDDTNGASVRAIASAQVDVGRGETKATPGAGRSQNDSHALQGQPA